MNQYVHYLSTILAVPLILSKSYCSDKVLKVTSRADSPQSHHHVARHLQLPHQAVTLSGQLVAALHRVHSVAEAIEVRGRHVQAVSKAAVAAECQGLIHHIGVHLCPPP